MLGPNAQSEWRAATVKSSLVDKQYAVTRGSVAGADSSTVIECAMRHFTGLAN
jgi:hypothetical protein